MRHLNTKIAALFLSMVFSMCADAGMVKGIDEEANLPFWQWSEQGLSIRLVQRLPDQTRAFFIGRGFNREAADLIGEGCVFQTVFRNDGQLPIDYDLSEWRVHRSTGSSCLTLKEEWDDPELLESIRQLTR